MIIFPQCFTQGTANIRNDTQNISSDFSFTNSGQQFTMEYSWDRNWNKEVGEDPEI